MTNVIIQIDKLKDISGELIQIAEQIKEDIYHDRYTPEKESMMALCGKLNSFAFRLLNIAYVIRDTTDEKKENENE
jgi:prophage DNA circulation protein